MKAMIAMPLFAALLCSTTVRSQTAYHRPDELNSPADTVLKNSYERETIYLDGNLGHYTKNKKEMRVGLFARRIKKEFENASPECRSEITRSIKQKKRGTILMSGGGAVLIATLIILPVAAAPVVLGAAAIGLAPYITGAIDLNHSRDHLNKAVWLHNRDVVTN